MEKVLESRNKEFWNRFTIDRKLNQGNIINIIINSKIIIIIINIMEILNRKKNCIWDRILVIKKNKMKILIKNLKKLIMGLTDFIFLKKVILFIQVV